MATVLADLTRAFLKVLEPVAAGARVIPRLRFELETQGWAVDTIEAGNLGDVRTAFGVVDLFVQAEAIAEEFDQPNANQAEIARRLIEVLGQVLDALRAPGKASANLPYPLDQDGFWTEFVRGIVDGSVSRFLREEHPVLYGVARFVGLIDLLTPTAIADGRSSVDRPIIRWDRLGTLASGPTAISTQVYRWNDPAGFDHARFLNALMDLSWGAGISARPVTPSAEILSVFYDPANPAVTAVREVRLPLADLGSADDPAFAEIALAVLPIPAVGGLGPPVGWSVRPIITGTFPPQAPGPDDGILDLAGGFAVTAGTRIDVRPGNTQIQAGTATGSSVTFVRKPSTPFKLAGSTEGSRLELDAFAVKLGLASEGGGLAFQVAVGALDGGVGGPFRLIIDLGDADGFLTSSLGATEKRVEFRAGLRWSSRTGFAFDLGSGLEVTLPVNLTIGPLTISQLTLGLGPGSAGGAAVSAAVSASVLLGPVTANVDGLGAKLLLAVPPPGSRTSFADVDVSLGLKTPTGIGIAIDAGSVSGGGFIKFDEPNGRYFGALELNVYEISVKAFGLIETKFPDGHKGFSFIVVISAEFTPIQLGFGFTLNGVGGLLGINRTLDEAGLLAAVKNGELENVLFPHDVVSNAPAIMHDLQTIFPAAENHYVFGPMAKLAWIGLVEGELGLILELPGPRLAILGTVRVALPTKEDALVDLQFDVSGVLDFPKKRFALDASLAKESRVGDFPISGDMAMRLSWGDKPNFALAIGGFNKHYTPPAGFPALKRMTIDLGVHGNPSINLSGYTALTSNTAQVGARLEARISQSGAELYGFVAFDALFVFSPFSFVGTLDGAVGVNFHGAGFSLQFHGQISGPSPWLISGQVCVSVLFWDACVGFSLPPLGNDRKVSLPAIDPWEGTEVRPDKTQEVPGLKYALMDARNWGGGKPPGSFAVVTLTDSATDEPPVDPLGSAIVRQKVCPLDIPITRFAGAKPPQVRNFVIESVKIGEEGQMSAPITNLPRVDDLFAPAQYTEMKDADKLSSASFVQMHAGIAVSSDALEFGPQVPKGLLYDTIVFDPVQPEQDHDKQYNPQQVNVTVASGMSAAALGGIRQQGSFKFVDTTAPFKVKFVNEAYVLSSVGSLKVTGSIPLTNPVSRPAAIAALLAAGSTDPAVLRSAQVTPFYNARL